VDKKEQMTKKVAKNSAKMFYKKLSFAVFASLTPHRQLLAQK